ncbi:MAG: Gfo/Idh/MocA family oxidoreductase [Planctomycetia bacterium]|nr:Gfo/Idh/MocA family oxidoreductase [Planctomycetia bacterium]
MTRRITRRQMLAASAATLGYFHLAPAFSSARVFRANEKLRVAGIGVGGKGSGDIDQASSLMEVVALCDVDADYLASKTKKWPSAKGFNDFRKIFDDSTLLKNIDAFTVSTPDHTHALPSILAMRAGKHVYCQKPLTHDVYEAHLMRLEAKKNKVCTQMGNQGTAANGLRKAVELIRSGVLGDVKEVHVWTNRPVWPQAPEIMERPKEDPVPEYLSWDEWLGPAPKRPYSHGRVNPKNPKRGHYHDFAWRGFWDFGTGAIGDMACHTANMAFMACKLVHPTSVSGEAIDLNDETGPSGATVVMEFPARGKLPPVTLRWYEGKKAGKKLTPPADLVAKAIELDTNEKRKKSLYASGSIVVGSKGIAYSPDDYGAEVFFSTGEVANNSSKLESFPVNNKHDQGQKNEWVEAIKADKPELALSNFGYASLLTAAFLLGNVALRTKKSFKWDGEKCAANIKEAAPFIRRTYRKGWDLIGYNA